MTSEIYPAAGRPSFVRYLALCPVVALMIWAACRWPQTTGTERWIAAGFWMFGAYLVPTLGNRFGKSGSRSSLVLASLVAAWIAALMLRYTAA